MSDSAELPTPAEVALLRSEHSDLRWLVGHLAMHVDIGSARIGFPPRLMPLLQACLDEYDPGRFTLANVVPPAADATDEDVDAYEEAYVAGQNSLIDRLRKWLDREDLRDHARPSRDPVAAYRQLTSVVHDFLHDGEQDDEYWMPKLAAALQAIDATQEAR